MPRGYRPDIYTLSHAGWGLAGYVGMVFNGGITGAAWALTNLAIFALYQKYDAGRPQKEYVEYAVGWLIGLALHLYLTLL